MIKFSLFILVFFLILSIEAQTPIKERVLFENYTQLIQYFPDLHSGGQYFPSNRGVEGHPFFQSKSLEKNVLLIGDIAFEEVPIQYDIFDDVLISVTPAKGQKTILNHEKIDEFELEDLRFIRIKDDLNFFFHKNGFYRVVHEGEISLYCKHRKEISKNTTNMKKARMYDQKERYLILLDGNFHYVRRKKEVFELMGLKKKDIKPQLKRDRIRFKKDKEAYLKILVEIANSKS
ncbi:hypothetical protein [Pleomorphovibrio marinus]|uniref:hypothetical protein n=1 Tax=Pleomorphovibrio marinus TaxID=2164132 RepID=UPI000E0C2E5D|nr:hypothetical protein [Pleomorphovibrio marinus]